MPLASAFNHCVCWSFSYRPRTDHVEKLTLPMGLSLLSFRHETARQRTCWLPALFPLPVAIETTDASAIISTGVVYVPVESEWKWTAVRRDCCRHNGTCAIIKNTLPNDRTITEQKYVGSSIWNCHWSLILFLLLYCVYTVYVCVCAYDCLSALLMNKDLNILPSRSECPAYWKTHTCGAYVFFEAN